MKEICYTPFFYYLIKTFCHNNPFKISDIEYDGKSFEWISIELDKLCKEGVAVKFEDYYVITDKDGQINGFSMMFNHFIAKPFVSKKKSVVGYYKGMTLLYTLGIIDRYHGFFDNRYIEVCSNKATKEVEQVDIGPMHVIVYKPKIELDWDNSYILQFYEIFNEITFPITEYEADMIKAYMCDCKMTKAQIEQYFDYCPDRAKRVLTPERIDMLLKRKKW